MDGGFKQRPAKSFQPRRILTRDPSRLSAHPVNFFCSAPKASQVFIIGDFNQWNPESHPMTRLADGGWHAQVSLPPGHHHYLLLIDGQLFLDPRARGIVAHEVYGQVSLL